MSEWKPIASAPKDQHLLLFGVQIPQQDCGVHYLDPFVFTGYWDDIDSAWCAHGSTANGPFFKATHWQPRPEPPKFAKVKIPGTQ